MRSFWEKTGVLGPVYRLLGEGLNDHDIAVRLQVTEEKVQGCIACIIHFFEAEESSRTRAIRFNRSVILPLLKGQLMVGQLRVRKFAEQPMMRRRGFDLCPGALPGLAFSIGAWSALGE